MEFLSGHAYGIPQWSCLWNSSEVMPMEFLRGHAMEFLRGQTYGIPQKSHYIYGHFTIYRICNLPLFKKMTLHMLIKRQ